MLPSSKPPRYGERSERTPVSGMSLCFFDGGHVSVHRLRETINGREYLIEVSSVSSDKWRAQIARVPGGSTALMPFYGRTPDEAAGQLSHWLEIAHGVRRC
jgi:hypothetical protein